MKQGQRTNPQSPRAIAAALGRDDLAEHLAAGGDIASFAREHDLTTVGVTKRFQRICADLGPQAV